MASLGSGIPSCFTRCWRWPYSGGQVIFPPTGCPAETWRPFASDGPFGFAEVPPDVATTTPTIATMRTNTPAAAIDITPCRRAPAPRTRPSDHARHAPHHPDPPAGPPERADG